MKRYNTQTINCEIKHIVVVTSLGTIAIQDGEEIHLKHGKNGKNADLLYQTGPELETRKVKPFFFLFSSYSFFFPSYANILAFSQSHMKRIFHVILNKKCLLH